MPLEPGRTDVVRLMNLHKAKGLEAPVVFLADPKRGGVDRVGVRIVRGGVTATGYLQLDREKGRGRMVLGQPAGWARHQEEERTYLRAEDTRLVYVAATRAKELLVVSRLARASSRGPWQSLALHLGTAPALPMRAPSAMTPAPVDRIN